MIRLTLTIAAIVFSTILISVGVTLWAVQNQGYIRFVSEPRKDNPDNGFLEINGKEYKQIYTTTEVIDSHTPLGSHYHRIDLRTSPTP